MKIDDTTKQKLRNINIEDVAKELGIHVSRHVALCFLHDDHHPSMAFNVNKNTWRCYVCNMWGDNISLVQKYNNQGFVEACCWLAEKFGISIEDSADVDTSVNVRSIPSTQQVYVPKIDIEIIESLVNNFCITASAKSFLYGERKYLPSVVSRLKLCSAEKDKDIIDFLVHEFGVDRAVGSGLIYWKSGRLASYFHAPCLFYPYYDVDGKMLSIQARYLGKEESYQRFQFPRGSKAHIFNLPIINELKTNEPLFVSEGVSDTLALLSAGYKAVAIPSATLLKEEDLTAIATHPLLMYPDNDEAGQRLFGQIKSIVQKNNGSITQLFLPPEIKDFSDYYLLSKINQNNVLDGSTLIF